VLVATLNAAIDNMLLLVSLPRRSMCFKRMLLVSSLHTAPDQLKDQRQYDAGSTNNVRLSISSQTSIPF